MAELCPGLPNWEALKDPACAEAFATPETAPDGRYLGGPVTWGGFDDERVEALDLPFQVIHAGTDAALFAELESAYQREAPVLLWVYAPHWAPIKYDGEWVEFPAYEAACYEDPAWGSNPDAAYDCGKPRGPIWKAAWSGVKEKWPTAHAAITAFNVDQRRDGRHDRAGRSRGRDGGGGGRRLDDGERGALEGLDRAVTRPLVEPVAGHLGAARRRLRCLRAI